jgi:hypothetical protein
VLLHPYKATLNEDVIPLPIPRSDLPARDHGKKIKVEISRALTSLIGLQTFTNPSSARQTFSHAF